MVLGQLGLESKAGAELSVRLLCLRKPETRQSREPRRKEALSRYRVGGASEGVRVITEAEVSLDDLRDLVRWDLDDYLSYREENPNLTPPY